MTNRRSSRKPAKSKSRRGWALGRLGVLPLRRSELAALGPLPARFLCCFRGLAFLAMAGGSLCHRDTGPSTCEIGLNVIPQSRVATHVAPGFSPARAALKGGATPPETEGFGLKRFAHLWWEKAKGQEKDSGFVDWGETLFEAGRDQQEESISTAHFQYAFLLIKQCVIQRIRRR